MYLNKKTILKLIFLSVALGPAAHADEALTAQVGALQQSMEQSFERAPSIVQLVHASPTSDTVVDYGDLEDSAIWTGIYLGGQCFREAAATDAQDKTDAAAQIQWALNSVEDLFDVTGTPGSLARFAFNPSDPNLKGLAFTKTATAANGWSTSKSLSGWIYMSNTSRDQYTGVMFGLGVCNHLTTNPDIKARTAARIYAALNLLSKNGWKIPGTTGTSANISIDTAAAWLKLAVAASAGTAEAASWETQYKNAMTSNLALQNQLESELNPTVLSNYQEYYAWNLDYLRLYPQMILETDPTYLAYLKNYMTTKMWAETWSHQNAEFTFIKLATVGMQTAHDQTALTQANQSLNELAFMNRRDFPVNNAASSFGGISSVVAGVTKFVNSLGLPISSYLYGDQSTDPLPMNKRVPNDYMWQQSPFYLAGGGTGSVESPSVDTIFSYWLGQYHSLISNTASAAPIEAEPAPVAPAPTVTTESGSSGYHLYSLQLAGTNYVGTINYKGEVATYTESAQALEQSYSAVMQAGSGLFSTLQADMLNAVQDEAAKLPGSHTASVQLGNTIGMKLKGQGSYSTLSIALPSIEAQIGVKIEKAWGLIVLKCTETVSITGAVATANLDVASGSLTDIDVHSDSSATTHCQDNIPLVGSLLADLIDHYAEKAINPTLAKFNAAGGYPLKSENFSGLNKLLKPGVFVVNGKDYGPTVATEIENYFDKSEIDIAIYNPSTLPAAGGTTRTPASTTGAMQPIFTLNLPDKDISLSIGREGVYSAVPIPFLGFAGRR